MKHQIWTSDIDISDEALQMFREEQECEDMTDNEVIELMYDDNRQQLDDEYVNLDVQLPGKVIAIADIGRWNGRVSGYKILGDNLNCVLNSHVNGCSELDVYGDSYNIRADEAHHDGTNHYMYRMLRDRECDALLDAIYNGKQISRSMLNRYTKSLYPYVANIYGWPCRQKCVSAKA